MTAKEWMEENGYHKSFVEKDVYAEIAERYALHLLREAREDMAPGIDAVDVLDGYISKLLEGHLV